MDRRWRWGFIALFVFFALNSPTEIYFLLPQLIWRAGDPVAWAMRTYSYLDPVLFAPPVHLKMMCGTDFFFLFFLHLFTIVALAKRWDHAARFVGTVDCAMLTYSLVVFVGADILAPVPGTSLWWVFGWNSAYILGAPLFIIYSGLSLWRERKTARTAG